MSDGPIIAFDADDTLWHNEDAFAATEERFNQLVAEWADPIDAQRVLVDFERRHVSLYGYGVKSFVLSMIAAACDISDNRIPVPVLRSLVDTADELLAAPTVLIDGARQAMAEVSDRFPTMIITKGDLHHQLRRIREVDLERYCFDVEVVADKDADTYRRIARRHRIDPANLVMVGNSIVSDVQPLLDIGSRAIHIPYHVTWALERADCEPPASARWIRLESIDQVPAALDAMVADAAG